MEQLGSCVPDADVILREDDELSQWESEGGAVLQEGVEMDEDDTFEPEAETDDEEEG